MSEKNKATGALSLGTELLQCHPLVLFTSFLGSRVLFFKPPLSQGSSWGRSAPEALCQLFPDKGASSGRNRRGHHWPAPGLGGPLRDLVAISTTVTAGTAYPAGNHPSDRPDWLSTSLSSRDGACALRALQSPSPGGTSGPDTDSAEWPSQARIRYYSIRLPCQSRACTR